jgi:hypothetical protein
VSARLLRRGHQFHRLCITAAHQQGSTAARPVPAILVGRNQYIEIQGEPKFRSTL